MPKTDNENQQNGHSQSRSDLLVTSNDWPSATKVETWVIIGFHSSLYYVCLGYGCMRYRCTPVPERMWLGDGIKKHVKHEHSKTRHNHRESFLKKCAQINRPRVLYLLIREGSTSLDTVKYGLRWRPRCFKVHVADAEISSHHEPNCKNSSPSCGTTTLLEPF